MLLTVAPLVFAVIAYASPFYPNATTSRSLSSSSISSSLSTITSSPYYNPAAFVNPYFYIIINTSGDEELSSLSSCGSIWNVKFAEWLSTAEVTTGPAIAAITETVTQFPWVSQGVEAGETFFTTIPPETITTTLSGQGPLYYAQDHFDFTASKGCCESCTIYGGSVRVYYWPSTTESQHTATAPTAANVSTTASTLVNEVGFTFVSPSIYVAFESLYAANLCGYVGPQLTATTLSFSEGELSTSTGWHVSSTLNWNVLLASYQNALWTKASFGDVTSCGDQVKTYWNIGGMGFSVYTAATSAASSLLSIFPMSASKLSDIINTVEWSYDPCKPTLSIPSQILSIQPSWSTCSPPVTAFFDPPYILSAGNGLSAFGPTTDPPIPGPTFRPVTASKTLARLLSDAMPSASSANTPSPPIVKEKPVPGTTTVNSLDESAASSSTFSSSHVIELQPVQILSISDSSMLSSSNTPPETASPSDKEVAQHSSLSGDTPIDPSTSLSTTAPVNLSSGPAKNKQEATAPVTPANPVGQTVSPPLAAVLSFGSSIITADESSDFIFASHTLTPGGQISFSGAHLSLASNGAFAVLDGSTTSLQDTATPVAVLKFGSSAITADISSNFVFGSQTLTSGGQVTISGTTISLGSNGASAVIDGTTTQILFTATQTLAKSPFLSGSSRPESTPIVGYVVSSQTLKPSGPAITVDGTVISLLPGGSSVLVGSSTAAVEELLAPTMPASWGIEEANMSTSATSTTSSAPPASTTSTASTPNLAGVIMSLGGYTTDTNTATPKGTATASGVYNKPVVTGDAAKQVGQKYICIVGLMLVAVMWLC